MEVIKEQIAMVADADTANEVKQSLESLQHIFDSKLQAGMLLNKRCKELGLKFDKVKKYMKQPSYRIYPSLLDKFDKYLRADEEVENFWNIDNETGEYKRSPEEIEESLKQDLLDAINRVPFESEAADKGTAFNAIIDCYVHCENHVPTERSPYSIIGDKETNTIQVAFPATDIAPARHFLFDRQWCIEQAEYFKGSLSQVYVSAILPTQYGNVELYGFIDELRKDVVYDIKSTSKYEFGKYAHGWQRHVYPYCLIASGQMESIKAFEFTAYALKGGTSRTPLISGTQYPEYYTYNHEQTVKLLTAHVEHFIEFWKLIENLSRTRRFSDWNNGTRSYPYKRKRCGNTEQVL